MMKLNLLIYMLIHLIMILVYINMIPSNYKLIHPIMMSLILFMFNIFICLNLSNYFNSNWWSMITFLIIIGGLMILFMYFMSFINNKIMTMKLYFYKNMLIKLFYIMILMFFLAMNYMNNLIYMINNEMLSLINFINNFLNLNYLNNFIYLYNYNFSISMILCLLYLLLTLFMIVKIIIINKFTLRKMN